MEDVMELPNSGIVEEVIAFVKRGRGRPRRGEVVVKPEKVAKRRGRPPINKVVAIVNGEEVAMVAPHVELPPALLQPMRRCFCCDRIETRIVKMRHIADGLDICLNCDGGGI